MAEMSPVELLQAAAAKVRDYALGTTPGPWVREWAFATYFVVPDIAGTVAAENVSRLKRNQRADAGWIALVHPGLAGPLAALLEREALVAQACFDAFPEPDRAWRIADYAETYLGESLAVARVLLGVPDGR